MAVVVTGAAGFIGSHLVRALAARGERVVGIDRDPNMPEECDRIVADLAAPDPLVRDALHEADAVWHLAARPGVRDDAPDISRRRFLDNICATHVVCDAVPDDVPLVFTSSSSVYGGALHGREARPCREDDELRPRGGYARSKVRAEHVCARRADRGAAVCVARPFTVAGEGQRPDMALARWIDAARTGGTITVFGSLERSRDITDVRDVVDVLMRLAVVGMGRTVNVGTGRGHTLAQMAETVFEVVGARTDITVVPAASHEVPVTLAGTSLLRRLVGLTPTTDLRDVVRRQAEYTRNEKMEATL